MNSTITNLSSVTGQATQSANNSKETASASAAKESGSIRSQVRASMNEQIIQASLNVSIKASDNPQGLLFRSSLESIYEAMGGKFESSITPDYEMPSATGANNPFATPEGTAGVILGFSLGLYDSFRSRYPDMDESEVATKFIETIRAGFEKGYGEAVDILSALNVFDGNLKTEIEKTYELVMKGYDDFLASRMSQAEPGADPAVQ